MRKILSVLNTSFNLLFKCIILCYTAEIVYNIFVGPESYWWPKTGFRYFSVALYGWYWAMLPRIINRWKDKNPGKNLINYLWSW